MLVVNHQERFRDGCRLEGSIVAESVEMGAKKRLRPFSVYDPVNDDVRHMYAFRAVLACESL